MGRHKGGTKNGEPGAHLERLMLIETDDCVEGWPFCVNKDGYPTTAILGRTTNAARVVCERFYGPPPVEGLQACHSCHNRRCLNKRHLRWDTVLGNAADRKVDGTEMVGEANPAAKLTSEQVREIRQRHRPRRVTYKMLAAEYGVSFQAIRNVVRGFNWDHLTSSDSD